MFKAFSPGFLVVPIAWLTVFLLSGLNTATPMLAAWGITAQRSWAVIAVQGVFTLIFLTPLWRLVWRVIPKLNEWVFPDFNGEWDVAVDSNWPRITALVDAAAHTGPALDIRKSDEGALPPLGRYLMRAQITQSWISIRMTLWNPSGTGPIKESNTLVIQPMKNEDGRHGLAYVFEQENATDVSTDESKFRGAAVLKCEFRNFDALVGRMWTDRAWRRGLNTAADLHFTRRR